MTRQCLLSTANKPTDLFKRLSAGVWDVRGGGGGAWARRRKMPVVILIRKLFPSSCRRTTPACRRAWLSAVSRFRRTVNRDQYTPLKQKNHPVAFFEVSFRPLF